MLELYEKRKILRMLEKKVVEIKQTPLEVLKSPRGVSTQHLTECHNVAILHLLEKVDALDELLRKILNEATKDESGNR